MVFANVQDQLIGCDGTSGENTPVDDQVRPQGHQRSVLEAARLSFRAIGDHDGATGTARRDVPPLGADREAGTAAAEQAAALQIR